MSKHDNIRHQDKVAGTVLSKEFYLDKPFTIFIYNTFNTYYEILM